MQTFVVTARVEVLAESAEDALQITQLADVAWEGQAIERGRITRRHLSWGAMNTAMGLGALLAVQLDLTPFV